MKLAEHLHPLDELLHALTVRVQCVIIGQIDVQFASQLEAYRTIPQIRIAHLRLETHSEHSVGAEPSASVVKLHLAVVVGTLCADAARLVQICLSEW